MPAKSAGEWNEYEIRVETAKSTLIELFDHMFKFMGNELDGIGLEREVDSHRHKYAVLVFIAERA